MTTALKIPKDHLGNVRVVITDQKLATLAAGEATNTKPEVVANNNYYAFGMIMPGRNYNANSYRFGFGGQEKDDEITGITGSLYTAQFWEYDARIGRRWNLDPKPVTGISEYACFENNPILFSDPLGDKVKGKTKSDAEKTKKEMENSLGTDGEDFINEFYKVDDDNNLIFTGSKSDMNKWMHKKGDYKKREGEKFTKEQAAMANGYYQMTTAKRYTVVVNFTNNKNMGFVEEDKNDGSLINVYVSNIVDNYTYGDVNGNDRFVDRTQIFVHELLGEAYFLSNYDDIRVISDYLKNNKNSQLMKERNLHVIQAENLYNIYNRSGTTHGLGCKDDNNVGLIPPIFNSTFNEQSKRLTKLLP